MRIPFTFLTYLGANQVAEWDMGIGANQVAAGNRRHTLQHPCSAVIDEMRSFGHRCFGVCRARRGISCDGRCVAPEIHR